MAAEKLEAMLLFSCSLFLVEPFQKLTAVAVSVPYILFFVCISTDRYFGNMFWEHDGMHFCLVFPLGSLLDRKQ